MYHCLLTRGSTTSLQRSQRPREWCSGLDLLQQPVPLKLRDDAGARLEAVESLVRPRVLVHRAVQVHRGDEVDVVAAPYVEVVVVVPGGHLECAGAERRVHGLVGDYGDDPLQDREHRRLADVLRVALIVRIDGHGGVSEQSLRPRGGDSQGAAAVAQVVADVVEAGVLLDVLHLQVG